MISDWPLTCTEMSQNHVLYIRQNCLPFETIGFISTRHPSWYQRLITAASAAHYCVCAEAHGATVTPPSSRRSTPIILQHIYSDRWLFTSRVCMCACLSLLSVKPTNKHPRQNNHHSSSCCCFWARGGSHERCVSIGNSFTRKWS